MSVFAFWLSKALWGWGGCVLVLGIIAGIALLMAGGIVTLRSAPWRKR
jgi:hypothetical protein